MAKTELTFYGAVNTIGGNKILLEDKIARHKPLKVWLDFGLDFKRHGHWFNLLTPPRKSNGVGDQIFMDVLPRIRHLYREDYQKRAGHALKPSDLALGFDGVLISHPHFDHMGDVSHLHSDMPIYSSPMTRVICEHLQATGSAPNKDFVEYKQYYVSPNSKARIRKMRPWCTDPEFTIKGMKVQQLPVDHSIPGASGFILHTSAGPIVYTGDLRFHGDHEEYTEAFVKAAATVNPIALITEGTNIHEEKGQSEEEVYENTRRYAAKTKKLVLFSCPGRDVDRLNTAYRVARDSKRKLAISIKQADLLKRLWQAGCDTVSPMINTCIPVEQRTDMKNMFNEGVEVYFPQKNRGAILEDLPLEDMIKDYRVFEREFLCSSHGKGKRRVLEKRGFAVNANIIRDHAEDYILFFDNFDRQDLIDLVPQGRKTFKDSCFIYSKTTPFNEEMQIGYDEFRQWIDKFGLKYYEEAHASGHASGGEVIERIVKPINAPFVIPIHTEQVHLFEGMLRAGSNTYQGQIIYPTDMVAEQNKPTGKERIERICFEKKRGKVKAYKTYYTKDKQGTHKLVDKIAA